MDTTELIGSRVTIFECEFDASKPNQPFYTGYLELPTGEKAKVSLWQNSDSRVTGGYYYSGTIAERKSSDD